MITCLVLTLFVCITIVDAYTVKFHFPPNPYYAKPYPNPNFHNQEPEDGTYRQPAFVYDADDPSLVIADERFPFCATVPDVSAADPFDERPVGLFAFPNIAADSAFTWANADNPSDNSGYEAAITCSVQSIATYSSYEWAPLFSFNRNWRSESFEFVDYTGLNIEQDSSLSIAASQSDLTQCNQAGNILPAWIAHQNIYNGVGYALFDLHCTGQKNVDIGYSGVSKTYLMTTFEIHFSRYFNSYQALFKNAPLSVSSKTFCQSNRINQCLSFTNQIYTCPLKCENKPNMICNFAATACICKPGFFPISDGNGVTISCLLPNLISTSSYLINRDKPTFSQSYDKVGICLVDPLQFQFAFCRSLILSSMNDQCFGRGFALVQTISVTMQGVLGPYLAKKLVIPIYDCWCDAGYTGPRCQFSCVRNSPYKQCNTQLSPLDYAMAKANYLPAVDYSSFYLPSSVTIQQVNLNLWLHPLNDGQPSATTFDAQWFRIATGFYGTQTPYKQATCYLEPFGYAKSTATYASLDRATVNTQKAAICSVTSYQPNKGVSRYTTLLPLSYFYLDTGNVRCYDAYWSQTSNPCPLLPDPRFVDLRKLNMNSAGLDSSIYFTYVDQGDDVIGLPFLQCPDQQQYNSNGQCVSCSEICGPYEFCSTNGQCTCQAAAYYNSTYDDCLPYACSAFQFGPYCDSVCQICDSTATCNQGIDGDGSCVCKDLALRFNENLGTCYNQTCGLNDKCSGNGECISSGLFPYCSCYRGFDGAYCQNSRLALGYNPGASSTIFDECDCSIKWSVAGTIDSFNPLPNKYKLLTDFSPANMPLKHPNVGNTGIVHVGNLDQAKFICYKDALCVGFIYYAKPQFWLGAKQQPVPLTQLVYEAQFLQLDTSLNPASKTSITWPASQRTMFYTIDRKSLYNCPSFDLNIANYRQNYFTAVQLYCSELISSWNQNNPNLILPTSNCYNDAAFISHWRYRGHIDRLQPNAKCLLTPVIQDPSSYCSTSRCPLGLGNLPCSGNGYCQINNTPNATSSYKCVCKTFFDQQDVGLLSLNDIAAWQGESCQYSVAYFCVAPGTSTLCSDTPGACVARPAASGHFYADQFQNQLSPSEVIPQCNCDGTSKTGQFCEQSKCGSNSGGCKSLNAAAGECTRQSDGNYKCVCQRGAIGQFCEIDASGCLYNDLKCSNQGQCVISNNDPSQPTHCECSPGFTGQFCENSLCPESIIAPGHGVCLNNQVDHCYKAYDGIRCEIDVCAAHNGTVKLDSDGLPNLCECQTPLKPLVDGSVTTTCWPQCPVYQGQMCGITTGSAQHSCKYSENESGQRTATCQCALGYIPIASPNNPSETVCEKYCFRGNVASDWIAERPSPCICAASTGYDIQQNHPRCDRPICANNGTYDYIAKKCSCYAPYLPVSMCQAHGCGLSGNVVSWNNINGHSPFRCNCTNPMAPKDPTNPFDCNGDRCGNNGTLHPLWRTYTDPAKYCICSGRTSTQCSNGYCAYCQNQDCLNGGELVGSENTYCNCKFPYKNGQLKICEDNECVTSNTQNVTQLGCFCVPGFSGQFDYQIFLPFHTHCDQFCCFFFF